MARGSRRDQEERDMHEYGDWSTRTYWAGYVCREEGLPGVVNRWCCWPE